MAAEKTKRAKKAEAEDIVLKLRSDPRSERRFEPKPTTAVLASMVALSVAAVLVGAGTYGQWFRAEGLDPHPWAKYMLAAGAAVLVLAALVGPKAAQCIRVGDAGIAAEKGPSEMDRIPWYAVKKLVLEVRALTVQGEGGVSIVMPLPAMREAAGETLREARTRMPRLVEQLDMRGLDQEGATSGETLPLEMPQVAGVPCRNAGKPIAFEKDARLCGRCGAVYHKDTVPKRCRACDARLK